ncbi:MAG: LexA family protein [Marinicella sp.]
MSKVTIIKPLSSRHEMPFYESKVPAGFPSPATEYLGDTLDLNDYLIHNKTATFFAKVEGDSMIGAGIFEGDLLVIDRSKNPKHNCIVVAVIDNEFTVKRLCTHDGIELRPENPAYEPIKINGEIEMQIWGVVTSIVRKL